MSDCVDGEKSLNMKRQKEGSEMRRPLSSLFIETRKAINGATSESPILKKYTLIILIH